MEPLNHEVSSQVLFSQLEVVSYQLQVIKIAGEVF